MSVRYTMILGLLLALGCGGARSAAPAPAHGEDRPEAHGHRHHGGHHRFEDAEQWAKVFDDPARDAWQKPAEVVRLLDLSPGMTVVDLGAGTGYFVPHLARAVGPGGRVVALDVEADMVRYIGERARKEGLAGVEARQVAPDDPGLAEASVDRILVVDTWHHLPDREAYAARLARGLRPGGFVLIVDFTLEAQHGPPPAMRLRPEQIAAELAAGGLRAERLEEALPDQYAVAGRR